MSMPKEFSVLSPDHEFKEVVRGVMWNKFFEKNGIVKENVPFFGQKIHFLKKIYVTSWGVHKSEDDFLYRPLRP
jgi:hypothetical protein